MSNVNKSKTTAFGSGVALGLLLAGGTFLGFQDKLTPLPVVETVTVERVVVKEVRVDRSVIEPKLYRASQLDAEGNVVATWEVVKCAFRVVGATLTDKAGNTFAVAGNIRIESIK